MTRRSFADGYGWRWRRCRGTAAAVAAATMTAAAVVSTGDCWMSYPSLCESAATEYANRSRILHPRWQDDTAAKVKAASKLASASAPPPPRVVVVGVGVAGVSSAYQLAKRGYDVVMVDSRAKERLECSAVAAGGMQRSNPVVNRTTWRKITANLFSSWKFWDANNTFQYFHIDWWKTLTDPHFLRWSLAFAYASLIDSQENVERQRHMLDFTVWAIEQFQDKANSDIAEVIQACGFKERGALMLHTDDSNQSAETGTVLSTAEAICDAEPFLRSWTKIPDQATYQPQSSSGNSEIFTQKLAEHLADMPNVTIYYNTVVQDVITSESGSELRIEALKTSQGTISTHDASVVFAAGSWTPNLMWQLGCFTPVYPLKGYCVRIDDEAMQPKHKVKGIITDGIVFFSQLGSQLRVASIGEFSGWNTTPTPKVDKVFREHIQRFDIDISTVATSCGLRPMSADGAVIVGAVPGYRNVHVNVGPGSNGWKVALGGGELLARTMNPQESRTEPFDRAYLSPAQRITKAKWWSKLCMLRHKNH